MKKITLNLKYPSCFDPSTLILDDKIRTPKIWNMEKDNPTLISDGVINTIYKDGDKWVAEIINLSEVGIIALYKQKIPIIIPRFNVETGAFCEFNIVPKSFLAHIRKPKQTKSLYKITCDDTFDMDFIIVEAFDEEDAWNIFWDKIIHDPNIDKGGFGKKEDYDFTDGYYHMRHGYKSISIDKVNLQNEYNYIGGGHIQ